MGRLGQGLRRLVSRDGTPRGIAGGFALGLALSLVPLPFAGMFVALALAPLLRFNLPATYAGTAVVNPITGPFIYFAELWIGLAVTGAPVPSWAELADLDAHGWWVLLQSAVGPFLRGAAVLIVVGGTASFAVVWWAAVRYRARHPRHDEGDDRDSRSSPEIAAAHSGTSSPS